VPGGDKFDGVGGSCGDMAAPLSAGFTRPSAITIFPVVDGTGSPPVLSRVAPCSGSQ
jgi:hypothetical protein